MRANPDRKRRAAAGIELLAGLAILFAAPPASAGDWLRGAAVGSSFTPPKSLNVTLDDNYAPYSFSLDGGSAQGIVRDLWDLWSRKTGVALHYLTVDRAHRMDWLDSGRADVVGYMVETGDRLDHYLLAPKPSADVEMSIFFDHDITGIAGVESLSGFTIGVVERGSCEEWLKARGIARLREYQSFDTLFATAGRGEVNMLCSGRVTGIRRLYRMNLQSLFRISPPLYATGISWAVRKDQPALRDFIAKGFDLITQDERQAIEQRWIGQPVGAALDATVMRILRWVLPTALLGAMLLFLWNASLRRQVAAKTRSLAAGERRYRELVEAVPVGIFETDAAGGNTFANGLWLEMSGLSREQTKGTGWLAAVHPQDRAALTAAWRDAIAARGTFRHEYRICRFDGRETPVVVEAVPRFDAEGALTGHIGSVSDLTELRRHEAERRRLERQSEESKKLEALGQFAGGIAHDFNNFLGAILGYAQFIVEDSPDHPASRYAQRILTAGRRGRALVEQILTFTRRTRMTRSRFHLSELLAETEELMFASAASAVEFRCDNGDPDAVVEADRDQFGQVLLNLCINAQDSLGGRPGTVTVGIRRTAFNALPAAARLRPESSGAQAADPGTEPGTGEGGVRVWTDGEGSAWAVAGHFDADLPHVSIIVTDTGSGMDVELLEQAFTPFFTTKQKRQGTGLGLAVVRGIVTAHGAALVVRSRAGEGTSIEVVLPRVDIRLGRTEAALPGTVPARSKGRLLLVDDDADFCDMMHLMLERLGFEVVPYVRGEEALHDFRDLPQTWDALISDQNMPGISGLELVRAVRFLRPDLPCLICSAYGESLTEAALREAGVLAVIRKPVDRDLLLDLLERALGQRNRARASPVG